MSSLSKILLYLILIFLISNVKSQTRIIKIESFLNDSSLRIENGTIKSKAKIDFSFFRENLSEFINISNFPKEIVNHNYRNVTRTIWNKDNEEKNFKKSSFIAYTYDDNSRIIKCVKGGQSSHHNMNYEIKIDYDKLNRPITIIQTIPMLVNVRKNEIFTVQFNIIYKASEIYQFTYAVNGDVRQRFTTLK
jgi:hypothetical protein